MHRFMLMKVAMFTGNFIFMAYVQEITLMRPSLPTIIQLGFFIFWLINATLSFVENFSLIFLIMMAIGGLRGTEFTNFLYLANAKVKLPCDMNLMYYERELTVNILLVASDIGNFFATISAFYLKYL